MLLQRNNEFYTFHRIFYKYINRINYINVVNDYEINENNKIIEIINVHAMKSRLKH